jgi:hypothetical protein
MCMLKYRISHNTQCSLRYTNNRFGVSRQIALSAEPAWAPPADAKWEEKDFEGEIKKLEKEAEERLEAKIAEMMSKIDNTGSK